MTLITRTFTANDIPQLELLELSYARVFPPRTPVPAQFYLSPYFQSGENVLCAFDETGCLVAYAPFFPQNDRAWVEVEALPGLEKAVEAKNILWEWILDKARQDRLHKLCFQYFPAEEEAIRFAESQGAQYTYSIFSMQRELEQPIKLLPALEGFSLRRWRMESEAEQRQYLAGRNECFPEAPTSLEEWQYFTRTPLWEHGVNMAAFWGDRLAASVLVYWEPGSQSGSTEHVFTRRDYRGHGLARTLLAESLAFLKDHGLPQALLEVKAGNRSALRMYFELGYAVAAESRVLEVTI